MGFKLVEMCYSYAPFQTESFVDSRFPRENGYYQQTKTAQKLTGDFHESLTAILTDWIVIWSESREEFDVISWGGEFLEVKSWHLRHPWGRRIWVTTPEQLQKISKLPREIIDSSYLVLYTYLIPDSAPEEATRRHGKYVIMDYQSVFMIFMRYRDCLLLYKQGKLHFVQSWDQRRILIWFNTIFDLIHARIRSKVHTVFGNIHPLDHASWEMWFRRKWVLSQSRHTIYWIDVCPPDIAPNLRSTVWEEQYGDAPGAKIA